MDSSGSKKNHITQHVIPSKSSNLGKQNPNCFMRTLILRETEHVISCSESNPFPTEKS